MKGLRLCLYLALFVIAVRLQGSPPVITLQPQDATDNLASAADFSVSATNAVRCQWRFNGTAIPAATNAVLALDDLTNGGSVDVILYAADGESTNSRAASLTVVAGTTVSLTIAGYPGGASSNLTLQLFDHDKPATVANFIHYIACGAYSNMFFDRCIPGFVLQGGGFFVTNPLNASAPVTNGSGEIFSIPQYFVDEGQETPNLPLWIDNEFNVGPLLHNRPGTIAMAKMGGNPDSAENAFFFNLADNSTNLDYQDGGFTVFGRVTGGTNAVNSFNRLAKNGHGIFDESTVDNDPFFTDLPVNYSGLAIPVISNLFYAAFSFPDGYPIDTIPPSVAQTNVLLDPNTGNLQFFGTASDNVALARVWGELMNTKRGIYLPPQNASGTANWSLVYPPLPAGDGYTFYVIAQDGSGNSASSSYNFVEPAFPFFYNVGLSGQNFTFTWSSTPSSVYQVQYKTSLNQTNWLNLGPPTFASSTLVNTSDLITNVQRFYRIVVTN
jgi:cyclophilin family peptidyl-prolyl cis-trans isomerase